MKCKISPGHDPHNGGHTKKERNKKMNKYTNLAGNGTTVRAHNIRNAVNRLFGKSYSYRAEWNALFNPGYTRYQIISKYGDVVSFVYTTDNEPKEEFFEWEAEELTEQEQGDRDRASDEFDRMEYEENKKDQIAEEYVRMMTVTTMQTIESIMIARGANIEELTQKEYNRKMWEINREMITDLKK